MASCRYCGIAHVNTEPRCASCGGPKAASDIHWLKKEERGAALETLRVELLSKEGKGFRKLPPWGWIVLIVLFSPILIPLFFVFLFLLVSFGSAMTPLTVILVIGGVYWFKQQKKSEK